MQQEVLNIDKNISKLLLKALNTSENRQQAILKLGTSESTFFRMKRKFGVIKNGNVWQQKSPEKPRL